MNRASRAFATACSMLVGAFVAASALAQSTAPMAPRHGGILKIYHRDSPPSASIHEEATYSTNIPFMSLFNNLVIYDQDVARNSLESIVPELATAWSWSPDRTELTFKLRTGVKWHDGKPFTGKDVKCTFDMVLGKSKDAFRKNPREGWYANVVEVRADNDFEVAFRLKRPQPALLALLASGNSPIYPCHVPARDMRVKPVGTGPFRFVEFKQNESIKVARNPDYWRKDWPYLDGIEFTIIPNRSTAILAFVAGKFDMTFPNEVTIPLLKDLKSQAPQAICHLKPTNININLIVNREKPPFDNVDLRRAMALALDRKAFVDILTEGQADIGASMLPPPEGAWGLPPGMLSSVPGYGPDVVANRAAARKMMEKLGYGPDRRIAVKVATRNVAVYRDPAVILIDQLKDIYIDGELEVVETGNWYGKIARKDYAVGLNLTGNSVDDPDQNFYENYACGSERNYTGYCNKDLEKLFDQQSSEVDPVKRKKLVWEIDRKLQEDVARPVVMHNRGATCWWPRVHGFTVMSNSSFNGWRFEKVWLDGSQ
jgi:peptide/nickel transport system substrate-binding protein